MNTLYGFKQGQSQDFDSKGMRVPLTWVRVESATVIGHKTTEKNRYNAVQITLGSKKNVNKPIQGLFKNLPFDSTSTPLSASAQGKPDKLSPKYIREIKILATSNEQLANIPPVGTKVQIADVFAAGDKVKVTGTSIGKGFAGVMKRHGFHGGPKTHGQSNRPRHPGSIGQTTTPGRVYKGKKMASHMGVKSATIQNLEVFAVKPEENLLLIRGLVPGHKGGLLKITKQ